MSKKIKDATKGNSGEVTGAAEMGAGEATRKPSPKKRRKAVRVPTEIREEIIRIAEEKGLTFADAARKVRREHKGFSIEQLVEAAYRMSKKRKPMTSTHEEAVPVPSRSEDGARRMVIDGVDALLEMLRERDRKISALEVKCGILSEQNVTLLEVQKIDKAKIAQLAENLQAAEQLLYDEKCSGCAIKKSSSNLSSVSEEGRNGAVELEEARDHAGAI